MILAHSYLNVNLKTVSPYSALFFWFLNYLPAVAFVWIAGTVFSYFLYNASDPKTTYRRYVSRAGFLLLVAHPAINLVSFGFTVPGNKNPCGYLCFLKQLALDFPITDTIAFCLLLSPPLIIVFSPLIRGIIIVTMLAITPFIVALVHPHHPYLLIIKTALFGVVGEPGMCWWPLIPWFAIFLTGSFLGKPLALVKQGILSYRSLVQTMHKTAIVLIILSVMITLGYKILKMVFGNDWSPDIFSALYPKQTTTLLPCYLGMLYWIFARLMHRVEISGNYDRFIWFLSVFGRTSLFTFIIQFSMVESIPALLGLRETLGLAGFLILFIIGSIATWMLSFAYGRMRSWISEYDYTENIKIAATNALNG